MKLTIKLPRDANPEPSGDNSAAIGNGATEHVNFSKLVVRNTWVIVYTLTNTKWILWKVSNI